MNGLEIVLPLGVMAIIFGSIVAIIKNASEARIKSRLIKNGVDPDLMRTLLVTKKKNEINALKYGLVMVGVGIALAIGTIIGNPEITCALMMIFGGSGLITVYMVNLQDEGQSNIEIQSNSEIKI